MTQNLQPDDEFDTFMDVQPAPPTRFNSYREKRVGYMLSAPAVEAPAVADALVLFVDTIVCQSCHSTVNAPSYVGLRRKIRNGHAYLAYHDTMAPLVARLPRLTHAMMHAVPWCAECFEAQGEDDAPESRVYGCSRVAPDDDISRFCKNAASARVEDSTDE